MLYQLYKKQVEAWKEKWREYSQGEIVDPEPFMLSSHRKDTIELLEAIIKEVEGMETHTVDVGDLVSCELDLVDKDDLLTKLNEQLTLLKNER